MKVLLKTTIKRYLIRLLMQSTVIWLGTNVIGSAVLWIAAIVGLRFDEILLLSLTFSSPAIFLLIPNLYLLTFVASRSKRITWAIGSVLLLCTVIVAFFLWFISGYPLETSQLIALLLPYILSAEVCAFLVARKLILASV